MSEKSMAKPVADICQTNPITPERAEYIEKLPLISSLLPYTFGTSTISGFELTCARCKKTLEIGNIKGRFETKADGETAHLEAYGLCYSCKTITPTEAKFNSDGTSLYKGPNGWHQAKWGGIQNKLFRGRIARIVQKGKQFFPPVLAICIFTAWSIFYNN